VALTLSRLVSHLSELIRVSNLTNFWAFSTGSRKAVDNPAALRASLGNGAGI